MQLGARVKPFHLPHVTMPVKLSNSNRTGAKSGICLEIPNPAVHGSRLAELGETGFHATGSQFEALSHGHSLLHKRSTFTYGSVRNDNSAKEIVTWHASIHRLIHLSPTIGTPKRGWEPL